MSKFKSFALILALVLAVTPLALAKSPSQWIKIWNRDRGRSVPLDIESLLFKDSTSEMLPGMSSVGFLQSDGTYVFGKLIWKERSYSPLSGFAKILRDQKFSELSDEKKQGLFLELLQQSYGQLGTEPYIGSPSKKEDRPQPMFGVASKNGSHRFQVWLMHEAGEREGTEWRRVIFFISPGAKSVKTRTLKTYHPTAENLKGFPSDSGAASD